MKNKIVEGFSKFSKEEKTEWLLNTYTQKEENIKEIVKKYLNSYEELQKLHDEFAENTITNFYLPFSVAPNFLINGQVYAIPMAIEESSVVAAASKAAKFWLDKGGFKTTILGTKKTGHVHFTFKGNKEKLRLFFENHLKDKLFLESIHITKNMQSRGGGILAIDLIDKTAELENYFQIHAQFDTINAMGANFINSCLEQFAKTFKKEIAKETQFSEEEKNSFSIIMCILSNYTPECMVRAEVSCSVEVLNANARGLNEEYVHKFIQAIKIAEIEPYRAATHNKGIMNGVDSVVIATGNDFRAVEASAHAYACKDGKYASLTHCEVENGIFRFWLDLPLAVGTVGGLTKLHPLVKVALKILGDPSATKLMEIIAVAGLAQNFGAINAMITTGIQQGHMKMHLFNILLELKATEEEKIKMVDFFKTETVSYNKVIEILSGLRNNATKQL
ncbi:MAG: hydroxymethylglutaryl-CoA reductase [Solirubrobacteraceae bacterium]